MQIGVFTQAPGNDPCSSRYASYVEEILAHAGLPWVSVEHGNFERVLAEISVLLLPAHQPLDEEQQKLVERFVRKGHVLIACGGPSGLDDLLGCRDQGPLQEAWLHIAETPSQPVTNAVDKRRPLHAFGGRLVRAGADLTVLAHWLDADQYCSDTDRWLPKSLGPAITVRKVESGYCMLIAPDLVYSIVRIQQGKPVHFDGQPAADGSAPVNDGILKTDDGIALDYERDRVPLKSTRFFGVGMADQWRELLIRALLWGLKVTNTPVPMLWYWPEMLPAVGLISHDSDGNDPTLAEVLLNNLQELGITSTWCVQYPGGYSPAFYHKLRSLGYEIALHYDAFTQKGRAFWREEDLKHQLNWLQDTAGTRIVSNKNHYLRWEGLDEFYCWLESAGVLIDQSKGPSKTGNTGFPFGGCHPWFPVHEHTLRPLDVLEINLATQDLALTCPVEIGPAVVDWALAHYGVAHFLFHPAHSAKPDVAAAMREVVTYGQKMGLPWWTSERIQDWERQRRQVQMRIKKQQGHRFWTVSTGSSLSGATLLWFGAEPPKLAGAREKREMEVYGFRTISYVLDLEPGEEIALVSD